MQGLTEGVCVWCKDLMMKTEGEMVMSETSPPDVREGVKPLGKLSRHLLECARNNGSVYTRVCVHACVTDCQPINVSPICLFSTCSGTRNGDLTTEISVERDLQNSRLEDHK